MIQKIMNFLDTWLHPSLFEFTCGFFSIALPIEITVMDDFISIEFLCFCLTYHMPDLEEAEAQHVTVLSLKELKDPRQIIRR